MPKVIARKLDLPTLWVDTAIGIKLAKVKKGEAIQSLEKSRMEKLKKLVVELVRNSKLLCPEGDQELEYAGERLEEGVSKEFGILSRGIRMLPHQQVHHSQTFAAMKAYVGKEMQVELPASMYFRNDPIEDLRKITSESVYMTVHGLPPMLLQMNNETRSGMHANSEQLRLKNVARGKTYKKQFEFELRSFIDSMADFFRSFNSKLVAGEVEFWEYLAFDGYTRYFQEWHRLTGKFPDWEGMGAFFISDYFYGLPVVRISSQLHAKLVTDNRSIESGDSMDVKHLSMAIPLAHFVLTDRTMANRIMELEIDREWNTKVFSESTIDDLFSELEKV